MLRRINAIGNKVWNGIAIGLLMPLVPAALVWWLMHRMAALREADLLLIGCIALNALAMNHFFKINKDNLAKGIISATFLWAFVFFAYKVF